MASNRFYATRDSFQLKAPLLRGAGGITLGRGVDMTDPENPQVVPELHHFFTMPVAAAAPGGDLEVSGDAIKDTFALLQCDSVESEAATLNTYFRASYGLSSGEGALEMARSARRETHSSYVLLTHEGKSQYMSQLWTVRDDLKPLAETVTDDEAAFIQFRRDFGTHYIHAITYGLTIAIRGSLRSSSEEERKKLGGRLKVGFGGFKGEAGGDAETRKMLQSANLDLTCEVHCGGVQPERPLMMTSFDAIAAFLNDLREGRIRFRMAPVEIDTASYWNLLDPTRLPRCRSLLDPVRYGTDFTAPAGSHGVPPGTVIAWRPTPAHIEHADDPARAVIRPPTGWALCDGKKGRPDLRGRFIRGGDKLSLIGAAGGAETHDHHVHSGTVARIAGLVTAKTGALVSEDAPVQVHLPPYVELVYIIKLDETH